MTAQQAVVIASAAEAKEDMRAMRRALDTGLSALEQAHAICMRFDQQEGWRALGYRSLGACLAFELQVTRGRAYDLIAQMKASVLLDEAQPSRERSRKALGRPSAKPVAGATESDQLGEEPEAEPVTHSHFDDGYGRASTRESEAGLVCPKCGYVLAKTSDEWESS